MSASQVKFLSNLDTVEHLASFLSFKDAYALCKTSILWRHAFNQENIWKKWHQHTNKAKKDAEEKYLKFLHDWESESLNEMLEPLCEAGFILINVYYVEERNNDRINQLICGIRDYWYYGGQA